ncbi:hypothetical protein PENSPDRAFT_638281 [Peniophora sp. CONT]|nr:hypothetical protein PENSPDRAFT_638281 [Peniophora sp. CONT]
MPARPPGTREEPFIKREEAVILAEGLASKARLYEPLPADTDLSAAEDEAFQTQVNDIAAFPLSTRAVIYLAFSAKHLQALSTTLHVLNRSTQPLAHSSCVLLLSFLPAIDRGNPYLRNFLTSEAARGLGTLVARAWCDGLAPNKVHPLGPGSLSTFLIDALFWSPPAWGDDGAASIDAAERARMVEKLSALIAELPAEIPGGMKPGKGAPPPERFIWLDTKRLEGIMRGIEHVPGFITSTQEHLRMKAMDQDEMCAVCMEGEDDGKEVTRCSRCKHAVYCSAECQKNDWKAHKLRCFTPPPQ